ncbi:hypothetical protein T265_06168 [Opisthorchis viverrini]|uniref:Uncharacterized protein n=1 Tax=Opisthorchis viverrini TaxID=6198 RepID=A0A074ZHA2_OPIVI|nr:hypothetical protein T265_06168 [Opisthorchis viverrini]KER26593.1 hypothetical protein T265_06168 [Opisthorchis viverrini]
MIESPMKFNGCAHCGGQMTDAFEFPFVKVSKHIQGVDYNVDYAMVIDSEESSPYCEEDVLKQTENQARSRRVLTSSCFLVPPPLGFASSSNKKGLIQVLRNRGCGLVGRQTGESDSEPKQTRTSHSEDSSGSCWELSWLFDVNFSTSLASQTRHSGSDIEKLAPTVP